MTPPELANPTDIATERVKVFVGACALAAQPEAPRNSETGEVLSPLEIYQQGCRTLGLLAMPKKSSTEV